MRPVLSAALLSITIAVGICGIHWYLQPGALQPFNPSHDLVPSKTPATTAKRVPDAQLLGQKWNDPYAGTRKTFETASNYAAFIHDAMQKPMEGGRFYALIAYIRCQEASALRFEGNAAAPEKIKQERARAQILDLKRRCDGVSAQFPNELAFQAAIKLSNSRGDPDALLPGDAVLAPGHSQSAVGELRRALASSEPYLIATTIELHIDSFADKLSPRFVHGENRKILDLATAAAVCEIVGDCKDGYNLTALCATANVCIYNDYRDWLVSDLNREEKKLYDETRSAIVGTKWTSNFADLTEHGFSGRCERRSAPHQMPSVRPTRERPHWGGSGHS